MAAELLSRKSPLCTHATNSFRTIVMVNKSEKSDRAHFGTEKNRKNEIIKWLDVTNWPDSVLIRTIWFDVCRPCRWALSRKQCRIDIMHFSWLNRSNVMHQSLEEDTDIEKKRYSHVQCDFAAIIHSFILHYLFTSDAPLLGIHFVIDTLLGFSLHVWMSWSQNIAFNYLWFFNGNTECVQ